MNGYYVKLASGEDLLVKADAYSLSTGNLELLRWRPTSPAPQPRDYGLHRGISVNERQPTAGGAVTLCCVCEIAAGQWVYIEDSDLRDE